MNRLPNIIFLSLLLLFSCKQKEDQKETIIPNLTVFKNKDTIPKVYIDSIQISFSYGFGECTGFCENVFEIHSTEIIRTEKQIISKKREYIHSKRIKTIPLNPNEYKYLINSFSNKFFTLADKIGCPDCDDTGWAKITVCTSEKSKTVLFPYSYKIKEIEAFQKNIYQLTSIKTIPEN